MRKEQKSKANFKIMLEGKKEAIAKYWQSILSAIGRYVVVTTHDAKTGTVFATGEGGLLSLVGKIKDALQSIHFGLDASVSKI